MRMRDALRGKMILVVEDEPLIASDIEAAVIDTSGTVVGPAATLIDALALAERDDLDGAIVDLHLKDDMTTCLLERLIERHMPIVIHSGSSNPAIASRWPGVSWIGKPADVHLLVATLADAIDRRIDGAANRRREPAHDVGSGIGGMRLSRTVGGKTLNQ